MSTDKQIQFNLVEFAAMAKDMARAKTLEETISKIMNHVGRVFGPLSWSLLLRNRTLGTLQFVFASGPGSSHLKGKVLQRGQGIAGWVAEHAEALVIPEVQKDSRFHAGFDEVSGFTTKSVIAVPLVNDRQCYGVIELINKVNEDSFDQKELLTLQMIADFAAIAIERAYYLRSVQRMALTDTLTGLPNRRAFERTLDREIEKTRRSGSLFSLLLIDVDKFKLINDQHGHAEGDKCLVRVAKVLHLTARKADLCARLGGDEFAVLLPDTTDEQAHFFVQRLQAVLHEQNLKSKIPIFLSIGARMVEVNNPDGILAEADREMYRQKSKDRFAQDNSVEIEAQLVDWMDGEMGIESKSLIE